MEQIVRIGDGIYYGMHKCDSPDDAYRLFRDEYNAAAGKRAYLKLNRIGQREERIHGFGFLFEEGKQHSKRHHEAVVRYRILGLLGIAYCRIVGIWDMPDMPDDDYDDYFDWLFSDGKKTLRLVGRKSGNGRTDKRLKKRYK